MIFIDTNYFLRYFIQDNTGQHLYAKKYFQEALISDDSYMTSTVVLFEVKWVAASFYKLQKTDVVKILDIMLKMSFIQLAEHDILVRALDRYSHSSLELEDCYNLEYAKDMKCTSIATFDEKLKKQF